MLANNDFSVEGTLLYNEYLRELKSRIGINTQNSAT